MKKYFQLPETKFFVFGLIAAAGILRLLLTGYFPNFSPVAAMALFGGVYFTNRRLALLLPVSVLFLTDMVLESAYQMGWREYSGFHSTMPYVYAGFLLTVVIGIYVQKNVKPLPVAGATLLSSILFFLLSNFGVWTSGLYPQTADGLIACYVAAIPFFHYSLVGDLFFVAILFGAYELVRNRLHFASARN